MVDLKHPAVTSAVFRLVDTFEVDLKLGELEYTLRVELFQDTERDDQFRARTWEAELSRLIPRYPEDEEGEPTETTEDTVMVERPIPGGMVDHEPFVAASREAALEAILDDLRGFLLDATGVKPE